MPHERSPRILIVEDEAIVATDLRETLGDMGFEPAGIAASADEALTHAAEHCPDLVLMDIRIRGQRDGIDTASLLRDRFGVPVVYLTAHADEHTLDRASKTEPFGYLMKPVKATDLRNTIQISLYKHQMENDLRRRERWFSTTLRSISEAVITADLSGRVTFMNKAAETLTGMSAVAALGRPAREVVRLLEPGPSCPLELVLEQRAAIQVAEAPLVQPTGQPRIIEDSTSPVFDEDEMLGAVMVFRDVTERKLNQRQLELTDRLASLGTMAAGVAHEVNNPLAVVMANNELLLEELATLGLSTPTPDKTATMIDTATQMLAAARRIHRIVADLQAFARPMPPAVGEADVHNAVQWAIRSTAHECRYRAKVITELGALPPVQLDETRLGQVLVNLVMNAAQAIAPGALDANSITIKAWVDGELVGIEVRDTGTGMPPDVVKRVFEPFFTTKSVGVGTGLGLAICHGIVVGANGRLEVESMPGAGTVFRVWLPVAKQAAATDAAPPVNDTGRRGRILVIDDEPMILRAMTRILRDHDVVCVSDARDALTLLQHEQFDLIFSDVMMPLMTGMEFYDRLQERDPAVAQRVVFVTGGAVNTTIAEFLDSIPNRWIEKPLVVESLRSLVRAQLAAK